MNKRLYCSLIRTPLSDKLYCTVLFRLDLCGTKNDNATNSISPMTTCFLVLHLSFSQMKVCLNLQQISTVSTVNVYIVLVHCSIYYNLFEILERGCPVTSKFRSVFVFFSILYIYDALLDTIFHFQLQLSLRSYLPFWNLFLNLSIHNFSLFDLVHEALRLINKAFEPSSFKNLLLWNGSSYD